MEDIPAITEEHIDNPTEPAQDEEQRAVKAEEHINDPMKSVHAEEMKAIKVEEQIDNPIALDCSEEFGVVKTPGSSKEPNNPSHWNETGSSKISAQNPTYTRLPIVIRNSGGQEDL